jgi:predicted transcriptional regulator
LMRMLALGLINCSEIPTFKIQAKLMRMLALGLINCSEIPTFKIQAKLMRRLALGLINCSGCFFLYFVGSRNSTNSVQ